MLLDNNDTNFNAEVTQQYHNYYDEDSYPTLVAMIATNNPKLGQTASQNAQTDLTQDKDPV